MSVAESRRDEIMRWLDEVMDPEVPVLSIRELGVLRDVEVTGDGVERRSGDRGFALMHAGVEVRDVTYSVGAQGTMAASFVDPKNNLVTMTKVYVE